MNPPVIGPHLEQPPQFPKKQDRREDVKLAAGKIAFVQYAAVAIFLFLITGFWSLQVQNPQIYSEQAERNRIRALPIPAPRGKILDRDGRVIVSDRILLGNQRERVSRFRAYVLLAVRLAAILFQVYCPILPVPGLSGTTAAGSPSMSR